MGMEVPTGVASAVYELEARELRFRAVFESVLDGIVIFDDHGRVLEVNAAAAELFGLGLTELKDRRLGEFCPAAPGVWTDVRSSGRLRRELEILRADGERRVVESSLTADVVLGQHVGVLRDVTDARRHERERLRLAERFERLFRTDLVGMALVNRQTGRVDDCNRKLAEFFGRSPDDFIRRRVTELAHFFTNRARYERMLMAWASGAPMRALPIRSALPDGTRRQGLATFESLPDIGDGAVDVVLVIDITEQHRLEAELRQAHQLEAIGRLAGGIAHEFNNLLAVISGFAALLDATVAGNAEGQDSVAEIKRATHRAAQLVHGLLAFSRRETFDLRPVHLHALVRRSAAVLREMLGANVELRLKLDATRPWVRTDPMQFENALQQLAANSREAMPDGGTFTVATSDGKDEVRLSVQDTGTGMDAVTLERAFEPFFTTKPLGSGTGLGLSTVYGIVAQSGGRVTAESEPSQGTSVHLFLAPAEPGPLDRLEFNPPEETAQVVGTETILLVEDETPTALLIESYLSRLGYRVLVAGGAEEAMKTLLAQGDRVDLLVTPAGIAAASGAPILEALRKLQSARPVVLLARAGQTVGTHDERTTIVLPRPFAMADLAATARRLLDQRPS
jgi:two-component system cell cycle sensor histidine kinase/response regulator CckA